MPENTPKTFTAQEALLELTLLDAEQSDKEFDDVVIAGIKSGLPPEVLTRLRRIWDQTRVVAGEVIAIGKIVIAQIIRFLKANPQLAVGLAIGAAVAALISLIPLVGPMLAPLAMTIGAVYGAGVAVAGAEGDRTGSPVTAAIALAEKLFELFAAIVNAVAARYAG